MEYKKNKNLIKEVVDEFILLYDNEKRKNHFLNETAGVIWEKLPDQFEEIDEFRKWFVAKYLNCVEIGADEIENGFDECIGLFIEGGLLYVYSE